MTMVNDQNADGFAVTYDKIDTEFNFVFVFSGDQLYDDIDYDNGSTLEKDIQVNNSNSQM